MFEHKARAWVGSCLARQQAIIVIIGDLKNSFEILNQPEKLTTGSKDTELELPGL
jgi:hypothetical protein